MYATEYVPNDTNSLNDLSKSYFYVSGQKASFKANNVCEGDSVYFTNTSTSVFNNIKDYSWDFGDSETSSAKSPAHLYARPGTYKVTLLLNTTLGCTNQSFTFITIYPKPVAKFKAAPVCIGDSMRFMNQANMPDSMFNTIAWDFGDNSTSSNFNPVHYYSTADSFKVTLSLTTNSGCSASYSQYVHVNPLPKSIFSTAASTCQMDSLSFTNSSTGADFYTWRINGTQISSLKSTGYKFTSPGTFTISLKVTNSSGCSDSSSHDIIIYPKPYATFFAKNACVGEPVNFYDSVSVANNEIITAQHWTFDDGDGDKGHNPVHTFTKPGKYAVQMLVSSSHDCSAIYTDTVTIYSLPDEKYKRTGDSLYVSGSYTTYQWYRNDSAITGATQPYYIIMAKGRYTVLLTNATGCTDSAASHYEEPQPTSISYSNQPAVEVYPNPGSGIFNVRISHAVHNGLCRVYDCSGKMWVQNTVTSTGATSFNVDMRGLPTGVYYLQVIEGNNVYGTRIALISTSRP